MGTGRARGSWPLTCLRQLADALADAGAALTRVALLAHEDASGTDDLAEAGDALARAAEAVRALMDQQEPAGCAGLAGGAGVPGKEARK